MIRLKLLSGEKSTQMHGAILFTLCSRDIWITCSIFRGYVTLHWRSWTTTRAARWTNWLCEVMHELSSERVTSSTWTISFTVQCCWTVLSDTLICAIVCVGDGVGGILQLWVYSAAVVGWMSQQIHRRQRTTALCPQTHLYHRSVCTTLFFCSCSRREAVTVTCTL